MNSCQRLCGYNILNLMPSISGPTKIHLTSSFPVNGFGLGDYKKMGEYNGFPLYTQLTHYKTTYYKPIYIYHVRDAWYMSDTLGKECWSRNQSSGPVTCGKWESDGESHTLRVNSGHQVACSSHTKGC